MTTMMTETMTMTGSATRRSGSMTMTDDLARIAEVLEDSATRATNAVQRQIMTRNAAIVRDAKARIEALTADFALQVQRTDEQREAYEQALSVMEADFRKYEAAWMTAEGRLADAEAERDKAYSSGYSDAETEISRSALGQRNDFLHSQYANAAARIKDLNELLDEAQTEWSNYSSAWMTAEGKLADAEDFIEAQAKDHASNNIRFAEATHRAEKAEANNARLRGLLSEADQRLAWEGLGFGNDFADRVEAALNTGKETK
jgi:chromosome segregation ATPase